MRRLNGVVHARLSAFEQIRTLIDEFCKMALLGTEDRHKLTLIVEELFTNTVTHGHKGDCDEPVLISLEESADDIVLLYEDTAPPFNPLTAGTNADVNAMVAARRIGGLGAFLTLQLTRRAEYSFVDGRNRIQLTYCPHRS